MRRAVAPHPWYVVAVAALTAAALVIRASQLDQSLFGDELYAFYEMDGRSFASMLETVYEGARGHAAAVLCAEPGYPPSSATRRCWMRLPSLACGVLLVPLTFVLGVRRWAAGGARRRDDRHACAVGDLLLGRGASLRLLVRPRSPRRSRSCARWRANRRAWWAAYGLASLAADVLAPDRGVRPRRAGSRGRRTRIGDRIARLLIVNGPPRCFPPVGPRLLRDDLPTLVSTYGPFERAPEASCASSAMCCPGALRHARSVPGVAATVAFCRRVRPRSWPGRGGVPIGTTGLIVFSAAAVPAGLLACGVLADDGAVHAAYLDHDAAVRGAGDRRPGRALPRRGYRRLARLASPRGRDVGALGDAGERPPFREAAAYVAAEPAPRGRRARARAVRRHGALDTPLRDLSAPGLEYAGRGSTRVEGCVAAAGSSSCTRCRAQTRGRLPRSGATTARAGRCATVLPGIHPVAVTTYVRAA